MKPLCIFHANCADGFGAALAVHKFFDGKVDFHKGVYGEDPPDVTDRDVLIVDFSYKRDVINKMRRTANAILVLDHHKTAEKELEGFKPPLGDWRGFIDSRATFNEKIRHCVEENEGLAMIRVLFDMERSGAMITWDFFFPGREAPPLIHHIQDRDLWRFDLPGTREIQAAVFSYPYDFDTWYGLLDEHTEALFVQGVAIERKHFKDVYELLESNKREALIGGYWVPFANMPYTMASDAGNIMATPKDVAFAACYSDTKTHRYVGLRSHKDHGIDVSVIAEMYGGGGHKHAAGFQMPIGWEGDKDEAE